MICCVVTIKYCLRLHWRLTWLSTTGEVSDDARPTCHLNKRDASVQFDYLVLSSGKRMNDG